MITAEKELLMLTIDKAKLMMASMKDVSIQSEFLRYIVDAENPSIIDCLKTVAREDVGNVPYILHGMKTCLNLLDLPDETRERFIEITQHIMKYIVAVQIKEYEQLVTDIISHEQIVGSAKSKKTKATNRKTTTKRIAEPRYSTSGYAVALPTACEGELSSGILVSDKEVQDFLDDNVDDAESLLNMIKNGHIKIYEMRRTGVTAELKVKIKLG
jgi:hypothetical protein